MMLLLLLLLLLLGDFSPDFLRFLLPFLFFLFRSSCSLVQMPLGPRKSGMPALVEMPAPVSTTVYFDFRIN